LFVKMRHAVLAALGLVVLADAPLMAQLRGPRGGDPEAARNGWLSSLAEGKARARETGKPLMVVIRCIP
jgi:hypothetical protein